MNLTNLEIDVIQAALLELARSRYHMPDNWTAWKDKSQLLLDIHDKMELIRTLHE